MKCTAVENRIFEKLDRIHLSIISWTFFVELFFWLMIFIELNFWKKPSFSLLKSEYIWKTNLTDNDEDDTLTFTVYRKYVFRPDLSNNLTGDEVVTTLHPGICKHSKTNYTQFYLHVYDPKLITFTLTALAQKYEGYIFNWL